MKIFVDGDGCLVKDEIYRVAERTRTPVVIVANKAMRLPNNALFEMKVVSRDFDAADDWISENATTADVVITSDILLANRCVQKGVRTLGPKGEEFTEDNVGTAVAMRELSHNLRAMGEKGGGPSPITKADRSRFLGRLDQILQSLKRQQSKG